MNKVFVLALVLMALVSTQTFAQSKLFAGGEVGFDYGSEKFGGSSSDFYAFTLSPMVGYQFNEKLDFGATMIFQYMKGEVDFWGNSLTGKFFTFGLAPFARYSLFKWGNLELLAAGTISFSFTNIDVGGYDDDLKTFVIDVSPVFQYNFNERFALYTSPGGIGYTRMWMDSDFYISDFYISAFTENITIGFFVRF
jgi:hypothetical protein